MARHSFLTQPTATRGIGELLQPITLDLGAAAITDAGDTQVIIVNTTGAAFRGTISAGSAVTLGTSGAIVVPENDYLIVTFAYPTGSGTAANRTITVDGRASHGTTSQGGGFIYLQQLTD